MIVHFFGYLLKNLKMRALYSMLWLCVALVSCSEKEKQKSFEESIVPFVRRAYAIKDSAGIPTAFKYIDSIYAHLNIADIDRYPIYTFKHNCYLNDVQNADSALVYADSMLVVIRRNPDFDWNDYKLVDASFAKADAYYLKGNYREAYKWYSKNKTKYTDADTCLSGSFNFRIAMSLYKEERYKESSRHFIASFNQQQICDVNLTQLIRMQEILSNIGLCYYNMKRYDSAMYYYNRSLEYTDAHKSLYPGNDKQWEGAKAVVYNNIGKTLLAQKQNDSAKIYLQKSIAIDDSFSVNLTDMLSARIALAKVYLSQEKLDSSKKIMDTVGSYISKHKLPEVKVEYYSLLWHYYYMTGKDSEALESLVDYTLARDSFYFKQKKALVKELYEQDMKISRITILALISVSITTLLIIAWLVRVVFKRKRTIQEQLEVMEEIAYLQSHEMRKPVATMKGLLHVFNRNDFADKNNMFIFNSIEEQLNDMDVKINEINEKVKHPKQP
jgi:tetratricopeptide (TPR) repeat protein